MIASASRAAILALAGRVSAGRLTVLEGGRSYLVGPGGPPEATIEIRDRGAWPLLARGVRGCIEAYCRGLWDSPDLCAVVRVAARNVGAFDELRGRVSWLRTPVLEAMSGFRRNTAAASRRDIAAHYDLGNDFFSLMLDPTMMYSCAVFDHPEWTLYEASRRKLDMVCDKLELGATDRVAEIGSGWGGFAIHAATSRGCRVTATTISPAQHRLALQRSRDGGLADLVDVRLDDYRELRGSYDKLVSIEMIEAVGYRDFGTFFRCCSSLLKADGSMLLQAIVIDDRLFEVAKVSRSFIRRQMFPNGCLPCPRAIAAAVADHSDLRVVHLEDLTAHYPETLRRWRCNFDVANARLEQLGYDERFRRLWRLYLAYSQAGFEERRTAVVQMVLAKTGCARVGRR